MVGWRMTTQTQRLPRFCGCFSPVAPAALPRHLAGVAAPWLLLLLLSLSSSSSPWTSKSRLRLTHSSSVPPPLSHRQLSLMVSFFFVFWGATSAIIKNSGIFSWREQIKLI